MKSRVKLYKAGKLWITALVAAMGIFVTANEVDADQVNNQTNNLQITQVANTSNDIPNNINGYVRQQDQSGNTVWKNNSGQSLNGWQSANDNWYQFNNGSAQTGWQKISNNWYYMNRQNAAVETGIQNIDNNFYYLNTQHDGTYGAMKTGWQYVNNNWYHFQNNGAANLGWLYNGNNWYYFNPDNAAMESGIQKINNSFYYLNTQHDGTYGVMKTGWQYVDGHWYGLQNNGAAYLGWQNLGGNEYYFNPQNAQMATGDTLINGSHYYFNPISGHQLRGMVLYTNGLLKYYSTVNGVRQNQLDVNGQVINFDPNTGSIITDNLVNGLNNIANHIYYFNKTNQHFVTDAWEQVNNKWYHFGSDGIASVGWFESPAANWYFFMNDGAAQTGWYKSAAGNWYYFDNQNAWALKGWQKINRHWYHFDQVNTWANTGWFKSGAGNWYYFDPVNVWADTGWYKSAVGNWYYFDNQNAWALKGWQKINNTWYYFDLTNAWADRGYHRINNVDYYFDPTNANMYQNRWVNVDGWTYHADNSGHLWFPRWYSQFTPIFTADGCSVFSLAMLLSPKEYINIPYALNLLSARQSGNIYTGVGFWKIIQPNSLVDLAHHFDGSVRNISGSSTNDIINLVNSGRPVLYYGYSSFERAYTFRNHAKVIVGYQNGWFRVFDPCYEIENEGSQGRNSFDYGPKGWITTAQFNREYAGQAITVD